MKICYFGTYSKKQGYPRNNVIIKGLRANGIHIEECHIDLWRGSEEKISGIRNIKFKPILLFRIFVSYLVLIAKFSRVRKYDILIVGYAGHFDVFIAKILNIWQRKPIVFDAFISLYDTIANERKIVPRRSLKAKFLWLVDKYSCLLADLVLLDSDQHIRYFIEEFGLPEEKFLKVLVGEDDSIFYPVEAERQNDRFEVLFFGTFISLQGIEYIVRAAKLLEDYPDIHFTIIGKGQLYKDIYKLAKDINVQNVEFINRWLDYSELKNCISRSDICLGIFGNTEKAKRVIPCKVYDCAAMAKPIITGDSPAIREVFTDKEDIFLCKMGSPFEIRDSILQLKNTGVLREKIAKNILVLFKHSLCPLAIGSSLKKNIALRFASS